MLLFENYRIYDFFFLNPVKLGNLSDYSAMSDDSFLSAK